MKIASVGNAELRVPKMKRFRMVSKTLNRRDVQPTSNAPVLRLEHTALGIKAVVGREWRFSEEEVLGELWPETERFVIRI